MDIAAWLRDLGLEQYEQAFRDNAIDVEVLPDVTDADLAGLGVLLGHRRKLLRAAATLRAPAMVEREASPGEAPSSPLSKTARTPEAERRQLTVLFCDLVGSTELAAQLDPEDMGAVLRAYQDTVAGEITRFEGHIAKYMGDGVLAYFGWPIAHEDDAERAVRAGLAVTAALTRLATPAGEPLAARVGIATGMVMVGQMIGEGAAQEQTVVGETPNLAARLQGLAAPGSVVISQATRRLVGGLFELADLGPQCLKGFAEPIRAWRLVGISAAESRFEAMHTAGLTPLIGREHELGLLLDRWERAKNSEGQVVLLSGEPGIGKSRITQALHERLAAEPHLRLRYHCSPYHVGSALFPVIDQLERSAGLRPEDTAEIRLDKLETVLAEVTENIDEVAPLLAALLWIPTGPRYPPLNLMPEAQKARTFEVLLGQLVGLAARQPVLMVLEDAHWIDPSSAELFGLVMDRIQRLPVLLLMTFRPEFAPPWTGYTHATSLTLSRLGQRQGAQMVERLTSGKPLPPEVLEQILAKTDGVPLFVEELTKTVLESGLLADAGDHFELAGPVPALAIPATLHDSLVARLDRLAPVKEVAQIGAVIGREFPYDLLSAVAPMSANQLGDALEQLVSSELVFRRGTPPGATYTFKHALVQDAAYQSLLNSKRQQLHASIAQVLQQQFPDVGETQPEVLAQHFTQAGLGERAIAYWRRAGELAVGRSANVEAIAHLNKGLELLGTMPDASERAEEEFALRLAIGGPLIATKGYPAAGVERNYSRAWALCEQLGRSVELFPVLRGLWNCYLLRELQRAHDLTERLVVLAEEEGTPLRRALARRARGTTLFFLGRFADAAQELDQGIAIDDTVAAWEDPAHLLLYTERAGVVCRLYSGWTLWFLGFPDGALERIETGLALGQRLAHANSLAFALIFSALLHTFRREFDLVQGRAEAAIEIASKHRLPQWLAQATICRGFALVGLGQQVEGIAQLRRGLAAWNRTGCRLFDTQWLGFIADAHAQASQFEDAFTALDRAAETAAATGECHYQAELYRLRGTILAGIGEAAKAESWLRRAIDTARSQDAKSLELRAGTSLAGLWTAQGKRTQAHDLLAPIYAWFSEGFSTPDLKDARALLDALP